MTALPVQTTQVPVDAAQDLEETVRFARSEDQLEAALERVQAEFEAGHLSQAQAERLTYLSIEIARQLEAGLVNVAFDGQSVAAMADLWQDEHFEKEVRRGTGQV